MATIGGELPALPGPRRGADLWKTALPPVLVFVAVLALWQLQMIHWVLRIGIYAAVLIGN